MMKRLLAILVVVIFAYSTREFWVEPTRNAVASSVESVQTWSEETTFDLSFEFFDDFLRAVLPMEDMEISEAEEAVPVEAVELDQPKEQIFSIHNIELGDRREDVEQEAGEPERVSMNEYGQEWHAYHTDYQNFIMVFFDDEDVVRGLYTNQDLISSDIGIGYGTDQSEVRDAFEEPIDVLRKGAFSYKLNEEEAYDMFELDDSYVTVFYDEHQDLMVTGMQIIDHGVEQSKRSLYTEPTDDMRDGFEYQLFDLTNAERVVHDLPILEWHEDVRYTARDHSADMAENQYFSHTNLEGQSPYDRMSEDGIRFRSAGENLAMGQFSSIYAHEGLMNSKGHRDVILREEFRHLGVGVDFGENGEPFFTEKYVRR
ncbi:CAP-associated domain-containing protein [Alkalihalobacillus sp. LMS6]|uniref:CAP domain-containing protein n=1 Tax=Alkalihalobacillus sp. LMS6 TaxID=2924034 RepID=UPI0020D02999|nr:CAP-associated domain-containing protein [Alkalihalobacillus sp. LMS6]UTR05938.1 CAP-associated domain-containing protein [Alkalihalobacillus sp. LMS6]